MSIRASISLRGAFLLESLLMIANNLIFFSIWWFFFREFSDINGWKIDDITATMTILSGAFGIAHICLGGVKNLGTIIRSGDLDSFMTQPKPLLLYLIASKSHSKGWGHIISAAILIGFTSSTSLFLVVLFMISGCLILTSVGIIIHSLTFWLGSIESVSQKYLDSLFVFALYPTNIYSGILKLLMFTLIPAGLIGYMPVELLHHFSWLKLIILLASSLGFSGLSLIVFYLGLKKYESGNGFVVRF